MQQLIRRIWAADSDGSEQSSAEGDGDASQTETDEEAECCNHHRVRAPISPFATAVRSPTSCLKPAPCRALAPACSCLTLHAMRRIAELRMGAASWKLAVSRSRLCFCDMACISVPCSERLGAAALQAGATNQAASAALKRRGGRGRPYKRMRVSAAGSVPSRAARAPTTKDLDLTEIFCETVLSSPLTPLPSLSLM